MRTYTDSIRQWFTDSCVRAVKALAAAVLPVWLMLSSWEDFDFGKISFVAVGAIVVSFLTSLSSLPIGKPAEDPFTESSDDN